MSAEHALDLSPLLLSLGAACAASPVVGFGPATPVAIDAELSAVVTVDAELTFFGIPLAGASDIVFALDHSGSMSLVSNHGVPVGQGMNKWQKVGASIGGTLANKAAGSPLESKMDSAKRELISALRRLPDGTRFGIVFFNHEPTALDHQMWLLSPDSRGAVEDFIRSIVPSGGTQIVPAMNAAYRMGARRVVLLSDGIDNRNAGAEILAGARNQAHGGVRIDTVGLGIDMNGELLATIAAETGGVAVAR